MWHIGCRNELKPIIKIIILENLNFYIFKAFISLGFFY